MEDVSRIVFLGRCSACDRSVKPTPEGGMFCYYNNKPCEEVEECQIQKQEDEALCRMSM